MLEIWIRKPESSKDLEPKLRIIEKDGWRFKETGSPIKNSVLRKYYNRKGD
jgi:hypothetical protein